ncbi:unnamed protein product [Rotaria sp. Silwood1]|nr:unnamed protein product [Rotaria sp. Silwood1]
MQMPDIRKPYFRIETPSNTQNPNEKIIVHLPNDPFVAENVSNSSAGCYTMGDILVEDPPNSGQYLILGRQDDTLIHINGKKTNPIPMEETIRCSPLVKQIAIIGHNQFCTAALIELNAEEVSNYEFNEIEEKIWEVVEQANKKAPSHSHLVRKLVKILPMNKTLPITHKGNLMRQRVNQEYSTLITKMYDEFLNQPRNITTNKKEQSIWTRETITKCLEDKLKSVVQTSDTIKVNNSSRSIFDFGLNSLQIIELRNFICQNICQIPKNFLYEYSSIDQMTEHLIRYLQPESLATHTDQLSDPYHYKLTEQIIDKYIDLMKQSSTKATETRKNQQSERVFIITGANGSLGNFITRDLLKEPALVVKRVYCLLRGSDTKQRLFESFAQRQIKTSILTQSQEQRLVVLPLSTNLSEEHLGQTDDIYQELQNEVTDIIHSAWKMDFNQTVKDFEYDSIFSVYNLLKLATLNNMQFHFISSIVSAGSGLLTIVKEEPLPRNAEVALAQGYGQSKYASEHLCWAAMNLWNIPVNIYRIGQISGDTQNGVWDITEMIPMMIYAGAGQLKKMPNIGEDVNWIPVDVCSASLVELALKSSFDISTPINERVYHLLNPHVTTYEDYLNSLRAGGLNYDTVSLETFINTILAATDVTNPLVKLASYFEQSFSKKETLKLPKYEIVKTVERCKILESCPPIDSNLINLYLNYWKQCQVLKT